MPAQTFIRVEDFISEIGYPDDQVDEADLQTIIERAHNKVITGVGRNFVETKRVRKQTESGDLVNTFQLEFTPIFEVEEIMVNRHEVLDSSNYTVDKQNGQITIDQSVVDDKFNLSEIFVIKYKPVIFRDLELYWAVALAKNQEIIELEDSEQTSLYRNAKVQAKSTENRINRASGSGKATDGEVRRWTK